MDSLSETGSNTDYHNAVNQIYTDSKYSNGWKLLYLNRDDASETINLSIHFDSIECGSSGREENPITWTKTREYPVDK